MDEESREIELTERRGNLPLLSSAYENEDEDDYNKDADEGKKSNKNKDHQQQQQQQQQMRRNDDGSVKLSDKVALIEVSMDDANNEEDVESGKKDVGDHYGDDNDLSDKNAGSGGMCNVRARMVMILLCFLANVLCYADRANISVAILPMGKEFEWSKTTQGLILSSFFIGYDLTQFAGGVLSSRFGGKVVLSFAVIVWSAFTILTPFAARMSVTVLFVTRVLMGMGEGVSLPAIHSLSDRWFPMQERSRSVAAVTSGHFLGTVAAYSSSPLADMSWPTVFYLFGFAGLAWAVAFVIYAASTPAQHKFISKAERDFIIRHTEVKTHNMVPWRSLVRSKAVWAITGAHVSSNYTFYLLLGWVPTYLESLGINVKNVGYLTFFPWVCCFGCSNFAGWLSDYLISKKGFTVIRTRKIMQGITSLVPAICLAGLAFTKNLVVAEILLILGMSGTAFFHCSFWVNMIDIAPNHAGPVLGFSNTFATLSGIAVNIVTGHILDVSGGNWAPVFAVAIICCLSGLIIFCAFARGTPQF